MSNPITIYFTLEADSDATAVKQDLEKVLQEFEEIEENEVEITDQRFTGLEVAAAIGAVIVVAESAGKLIDTSTDLVNKLTKLVASIKGLKEAIVETPDGAKPLAELTGEQLMALASEE